jgi:hypothetical protein
MSTDDDGRPRAFLTCAARAMSAVEPVLDEAERLLLERGWRTRLPRRADVRDGLGIDDRRRLRRESYREIERATIVVHVPAPSSLGGMRLHRELGHAVRRGVPVLLLAVPEDRARLGVGIASPARMDELVVATNGTVVDSLADLTSVAERLK